MAYKIKGRVMIITPTQSFAAKSGNSYQSRYVVIQAIRYDQYTGQPTVDPENTPKFTFFNKQCETLDNIKVGDIVTVNFDIQGKSFDKDSKKEYFTEVRPFRVDIDSASANQTQQPNGQTPQQPFYPSQSQQYAPAPSQAPQAYQPPIQPNPTPFGQTTFPPAPTDLPGDDGDLPF